MTLKEPAREKAITLRMTVGAYLCLHLLFGRWALISLATFGMSGGSISLNLLSISPLSSLSAKIASLGPFHDGCNILWKWVFRWQWVLYRSASNTFRTSLPQKVSCEVNTELTKSWSLCLRGLWKRTLCNSDPDFPIYQLYDLGWIINLAVFEFSLMRLCLRRLLQTSNELIYI